MCVCVCVCSVKCPVGTFFNVVSELCVSCALGTYQPEEAQLTCLFCPTNTSTAHNQSTSVSQCKGCHNVLHKCWVCFSALKILFGTMQMQLSWYCATCRPMFAWHIFSWWFGAVWDMCSGFLPARLCGHALPTLSQWHNHMETRFSSHNRMWMSVFWCNVTRSFLWDFVFKWQF